MIGGVQSVMLGGAVKAAAIVGHRYWRIIGASTTTYSASYPDKTFGSMEFQFFSSSDGTGVDLTTGKSASAFGQYQAYGPANGNDNNLGSMWFHYNPATYTWWAVDLVTPADVCSISIKPYWISGAVTPRVCQLQYSDDNINWVTKAEFTTLNVNATNLYQNL